MTPAVAIVDSFFKRFCSGHEFVLFLFEKNNNSPSISLVNTYWSHALTVKA